MRIGVFGGTFDPPHIGHLALARAAIQQLNLDEVLFLPANRNPLKDRRVLTAAKDRLEMLRRIIEGEPKMAVSDIELTRGGKSFSVDTMAELQMVQPAEYWFLMGTDTLRLLPKWKAPERLIRMCRIGAVLRDPYADSDVLRRLPEELRQAIDVVNMKPVPASSSEIRERIETGREASSMTPPSVLSYIRENKLYRA